ncbi:MAG: hypothetical protein ABT940_04505 [Alphaproteobacteria bacterium]
MSDNNVLFAGLPRTPEIFLRSLTTVAQLQAEGLVDRILVSTWHSERDTFRNLCRTIYSSFPNARIFLLTSLPPAVGFNPNPYGNPLHQNLAIGKGLEILPQDGWVLRTRADLYLGRDLLLHLFTNIRRNMEAPSGVTSVLGKRIWVPWLDALHPFYIGDECFYGQVRDVARVVNCDATLYVCCFPSINAHINLHYFPFMKSFRMFLTYFELSRAYNIRLEAWLAMPKSRFRHKAYVKMIALYWKIMLDNYVTFSLFGDDGQLEFYPAGQSKAPLYEMNRLADIPRDFDTFVAGVDALRWSRTFLQCRDDRILKEVVARTMEQGGHLFSECWAEIERGDFGDDAWWRSSLEALMHEIAPETKLAPG